MSSEKLLRRVILFKFKDGISQEQIAEAGNAFLALPAQIDAVYDVEWGKAITEPEPYSHCLLVSFRTAADMQTYNEHPAHTAIGEKYGHFVESLAGLDYWSKE